MERRPHRPGGFWRSIRRRERNKMAAETANEQIRDFQKSVGEPLEVFFPLHQKEPDAIGHTVFVSPDYIEPVSPLKLQLERFFTFSKNEPLSSAQSSLTR